MTRLIERHVGAKCRMSGFGFEDVISSRLMVPGHIKKAAPVRSSTIPTPRAILCAVLEKSTFIMILAASVAQYLV